ncbi:MAG: acetyltransferase [Microbacterium sp. SCN 70-200]|uniref:sugar O-acetyltransferase n=1 Tax=unclassified Microbacterium TaxID=2609290 RepID=UPI0008693300|nr:MULTISPECIES: sugar O-acetyltransferase [unclassified Microbacterium]MBN9214993.1 sugar O-acetyltransferase [Microbacterium sp.]ODT42917.1 MAG: acetyltransferase [Microbacterium sp. SCN 70-200]OJV84776.1 MAG: acetyltransferase [Microbacterium sp. 70-16]
MFGVTTNSEPAERLARLIEEHDDVRALFAEEWIRYRTSTVLPELTREAQSTCARINRIFFDDPAEALRLFHELVPGAGSGIDFRPPLNLDYGVGLTIGDRTFINKDFLIVGGGYVTIGVDCLIGPRCSIYTPHHAEGVDRRRAGWERARPVTIGDNVWLGGSVTITPGVTIGDDAIIGAGSVVTRDIPARVVAAGNPCRPLRPIAAD